MVQTDSLKQRWLALQLESPHLRTRDAADRLGVTEGELLASTVGDTTLALEPAWTDLIGGLEDCGRVMALTRNPWAVHEKRGVYAPFKMAHPSVGGVYGPEIDLRLFPGRWERAFATTVPSRRGPLASIQLFDVYGTAVHKIYATPDTDREAWDSLVARMTSAEQSADWSPETETETETESAVDRDTFVAEWDALKDTHDFIWLLRRHKIRRRAAFTLAEGKYTTRLATDAVQRVLSEAASSETPLMVFVGNPGCLQIHSGPVHRVVEARGWLNVLDPGFDLHLQPTGFAEVWRVEKPTADGIVTSIEVLAPDGSIVVRIFGVRKPGIPEDTRWRALATRM
jgi:putative hemin transport protein